MADGASGVAFLGMGALTVGGGSALMLLNFAQRDMSWFSFGTSLLGFILSFGIIALVPYDVWEALAAAEAQRTHAPVPSQVLVGSSWELIYWATFLLCWLLCPVMIEFETAGDFTTMGKLRTSLRRNATWYTVYCVVGGFVLLWLTVDGAAHGSLSAWCIAASNAWGLLVSTVLMGYGLVAVPRHLWGLADPQRQLRKLYCLAVTMDEARLSTQFELQDVISEARVEVATRNHRMWDPKLERALNILQQTLEDCELLHCELTNGARGQGGPGAAGASVGALPPRDLGSVPARGAESMRLDCLAQLHRALKQAALQARRATCRWDELVQRCSLLEDLEENMLPTAAELVTSWQGSPLVRSLCRSHWARNCWHFVVLAWLRTLRPRVLRSLGAVCAALSFVIVLGQLTMFSDGWSLSLLAMLFDSDHGFGWTQALCIVPLSYMICTAYWSVFRLKIAGWYGLYANHNTDTSSLLWCASILARLAAPLCYHFLLLIRVKGTAFQGMMGQMDVVPVLGNDFNRTFPILVAVLCACNLLNVYSRLVQYLGLDSLEFEWASSGVAETDGLLAEGRRLLERERRRRSEERSLLELHDRNADAGSATGGQTIVPLRLQIAAMVEDGTLPYDWNSQSAP
eukprot:TRINITY_DN28249_c0_g1_i1.p1 TRINITY_DN28249_c0_g1~~TRINITY_DN28249_c0_g1_i1.p1  ORF type:complete len:670 (-),score=140.27 TRINITY_DN28249_c0_g1_i1:85-1974(-)